MSLNIKNDRVHELAREAARVTGKSMTGAIEEALEQLLVSRGADHERARVEALVRQGLAIGDAYANDRGDIDDDAAIASIEDLYDGDGLPR